MSKNDICNKCMVNSQCEVPCEAFRLLHELYTVQNDKDKTARIRNLSKLMDIQESKPSRKLKHLGEKIINHFPEFDLIREWDIRIGYVISQERKKGEKITFADCRLVQEVYKAYLPFDFIITFYDRNTEHLNDNQLKILMFHELRHVAIGDKGIKLRPHDVEDFSDILKKYGIGWEEYGRELPDIMAGE